MVMSGGQERLKEFFKSVSREDIRTPAFVYDEGILVERASRISTLAQEMGCHFLYSVKPCAQLSVMNVIRRHVEGFGVSSLFEAKLCREEVSSGGVPGLIHIATPCYRANEIDELSQYVDRITFNSLPQFKRLTRLVKETISVGLRANPEMSFLEERKYDPCCPDSKLGVPLRQLRNYWKRDGEFRTALRGIHFHNNCGSTRLNELLLTVKRVIREIPEILRSVAWINLGGGYLFGVADSEEAFAEAVGLLRDVSRAEVYIEPGEAVVGEAGCLISEVVDIFESNGKRFAVLDTTVSHIPEFFEYGLEPMVIGHGSRNRWRYVLAGASCLAGDVFGKYAFQRQLEVGQRILFMNVGAYTLTKASMFNGIGLPAVYFRRKDGTYSCEKIFSFDSIIGQCADSLFVSNDMACVSIASTPPHGFMTLPFQ